MNNERRGICRLRGCCVGHLIDDRNQLAGFVAPHRNALALGGAGLAVGLDEGDDQFVLPFQDVDQLIEIGPGSRPRLFDGRPDGLELRNDRTVVLRTQIGRPRPPGRQQYRPFPCGRQGCVRRSDRTDRSPQAST